MDIAPVYLDIPESCEPRSNPNEIVDVVWRNPHRLDPGRGGLLHQEAETSGADSGFGSVVYMPRWKLTPETYIACSDLAS
ncbi:hypothetical protein RRF57_008319 [Xylaria bambusicola]|uniref:Uncharacterized protein n=1 Tax=Xylaria bambusicola TaxID=326684 RepID=A0AAN7UHJ0_9PEZI